MTPRTEQELRALKSVNFDWTMHIKNIWQDSAYDIKQLHGTYRIRIDDELKRLRESDNVRSPLGIALVGESGAGKTHLLSALRKHALAHGYGFILVDMTDVLDFWRNVLQGYLSSLQELEGNGRSQLANLTEFLLNSVNSQFSATELAQADTRTLHKQSHEILSTLGRQHRQDTTRFQDVIRAILIMNSDDFLVSNIGYNWLQGLGAGDEDRVRYGLSANMADEPSQIVEGLSWLMSLRSPVVLALDHLDSIVTQHHLTATSMFDKGMDDEQRTAWSIIMGISGGLMGLRDKTLRTQIVLSCLEQTWQILLERSVESFQDRFHKPLTLGQVLQHQIAQDIVSRRLKEGYSQHGFTPPYPTWPFTPQFFEEAREQYPRRILQRCYQHREVCLNSDQVVELSSFSRDKPAANPVDSQSIDLFDRELTVLKQEAEIVPLLDEQNEDSHLGKLILDICHVIALENPTRDDVDRAVDADFGGGKRYPPLHARLCLIFRNDGDREKHLSMRVLQRSNPTAYGSRLRAAMDVAGINRKLGFRRLILVRTYKLPKGPKTEQLTRKCQEDGCLFVNPSENELRILVALRQMKVQHGQIPAFVTWLQNNRAVSQLPFLQPVISWLFEDTTLTAVENVAVENIAVKNVAEKKSQLHQSSNPLPKPTARVQPESKAAAILQNDRLPLGQRLIDNRPAEEIMLPINELTKHTVILAGSGSGKTVLIKRLVEEAALLGIPSILIDGANDLASMGDAWPEPMENWLVADLDKADRYHEQSNVVVWTPGKEAGNPLYLEPLPDLAAVANDVDELNEAINMAYDTLQENVAPGKSQRAAHMQGILRAALRYFALNRGGGLDDFIELLRNLPQEAGGGISKAEDKALTMADNLLSALLKNPLLAQQGTPLDPAILFGLHRPEVSGYISVISLIGLMGLEAQQNFLNQLAMTLFTWIKKNPAPPEQPLRGLLVIDEARDYVPAGKSTPCKSSLIRLAAQARKYGLGLIFATQTPKGIDNQIIANCSVQFYGRANSPNEIAVSDEQLSQRGSRGHNVSTLQRGHFYVSSESISPPVKIQSPLCLSHYRETPLDESEVIKRATAARV